MRRNLIGLGPDLHQNSYWLRHMTIWIELIRTWKMLIAVYLLEINLMMARISVMNLKGVGAWNRVSMMTWKWTLALKKSKKSKTQKCHDQNFRKNGVLVR